MNTCTYIYIYVRFAWMYLTGRLLASCNKHPSVQSPKLSVTLAATNEKRRVFGSRDFLTPVCIR